MKELINNYKKNLSKTLEKLEIEKVKELCESILSAWKTNNTIYLCGNGGSFADAQHISAEFTSRFLFDRPALASIALGCNSSAISAMGNDYGYDFVFARELDAIAQEGDLFIPISTSGNSKNIIEAIKVAQQKQLVIYGLTGNKAGVMTQLCDCIEVPSSETPRIQECHILIGHILCQMVEASIFSS